MSSNKTKSKQPKIDLTDDDFTCILTAAIRYTLGRETYLPSLITGYIKPLLPYLTDKALFLFERDIREQGNTGYKRAYGDPLIDKPVWDKFYADVVAEMDKRKDRQGSVINDKD